VSFNEIQIGLTEHFDYASGSPGVGGAQARCVSAVGRARGPGRVTLGFI